VPPEFFSLVEAEHREPLQQVKEDVKANNSDLNLFHKLLVGERILEGHDNHLVSCYLELIVLESAISNAGVYA
jgi:hypothetical protein